MFISHTWLPDGFTLVGHDSGLPLDAKEFLKTRLFAWDDRLGFGLDNSVNFGSLTIHFIDWLSSVVAGVPYAGSFISVFFWLGLIFLATFIFAYQLRNIFGNPFVYILPILATFNFYVFQSVFMLERGKFGVFSATLLSLSVYFRLQDKKLGVVTAAIISALLFSVFNGGGLFAVTLYGGAILIISIIFFSSLVNGIRSFNFDELKHLSLFILFGIIFYLAFNAYSIVPYLGHFFADDPTAIFEQALFKNNKDWLEYVSRSTSFINLFRSFGVPDWFGGYGETDKSNISHAYASLYLNNVVLSGISFLLPIISFLGLVFAKKGKQLKTLSLFALITLLGIFLAAGSHEPFGFLFEFLMQHLPGFVLFRSAFYKFDVFYLLGMLVMFAFTLSYLIEKISRLFSQSLRTLVLTTLTFICIGSWLGYHWVLFDANKIFSWKSDQSTKVEVPKYVFDFALWIKTNDLNEERVLLVPPGNADWQSDAYKWGYWSLSPLSYSLTTARTLSRWHGLSSNELASVNRMYDDIKNGKESDFLLTAGRLNVGYLLLREDVLTDSTWSPGEKPERFKKAIEFFDSVTMVYKFGEWELYKINITNSEIYVTNEINTVSDKYVSLANQYFDNGHSVGSSAVKLYSDFSKINTRNMEVYDCVSCPLERKSNIQSLPDINILPNSFLYFVKERQENKVLATNIEETNKMPDYLGFVLRRSSEQKRMIDFGVNEKYLLKNADVIRGYLDNIYLILQKSPDNAQNFEIANLVFDYIKPANRMFTDYAKTSEFSRVSRKLSDITLGVIWELNRIEEYFSPLTQNSERWSNEKVYVINFDQPGDYGLLLPTAPLPIAINGEVIVPTLSLKQQNGQTSDIVLEPNKDGWLKSTVNITEKGKAQLTLIFNELPNLLKIEKSGLQKFAYGENACYEGSIANFDRKRAYEVTISKSERPRSTKIIFSDKSFIYSEKHRFLQGEDSFEIPAGTGVASTHYIFFPSASADIITMYICGDNKELPVIDKMEVREFFAPPVIGVRGQYNKNNFLPVVNYSRQDPTSYEVQITGDIQTAPYLLVFNEKYNPSWKLSMMSSDGHPISVSQHFEVDGFANGWLITQSGKSKFKIEYVPQAFFRIASIFSILSVLISCSWLVYLNVRSKKRNVS